MSPLELIAAHPWRQAVFTTYALSLAFFEAVVLDALVRGGSRQAMILADVDGVRAALNEEGARRAGRDYQVEPVKVQRGVFHPKVVALEGDGQSHLLVGSGNLTFGGWGGNLEVIEHLHPSFAADAFEDAAGFFDKIASSGTLRHGVTEQCGAIAEELRAAAMTGARTGNIRLLHSLDGSVSDQLIELADELGGATRLVAAAPFWDHGAALDLLCDGLHLDHAFVHAHPKVVQGKAGGNWPRAPRCRVEAVAIVSLDDTAGRPLHGKVFEVLCRRGRIILSGSANATAAALGVERNVEACIARVQRGRLVGWSFSPSAALEASETEKEPKHQEEEVGILRATLDGDQVSGQVLTPGLIGAAEVFKLGAAAPERLTDMLIDGDGRFSFDAPGLELQSWRGGRLVLRVRVSHRGSAEGFVSVAAFADIARRAGAMGPRLLALLAGTETPADVAAIMSWLQEDPGRLALSAHPSAHGGGGAVATAQPDARVALSELVASELRVGSGPERPNDEGAASWRRFMSDLLACMREPRGSFGGTGGARASEDDEDDGPTVPTAPDPGIERSFVNVERLLDDWLSPQKAARLSAPLLTMVLFVCDRLHPEAARARKWFERLADGLPRTIDTDAFREELAAIILALFNLNMTSRGARVARSRLLRLGVDMDGPPPDDACAAGPRSVLDQQTHLADLWIAVRAVRTLAEQAATYVAGLEGGPSPDCPDLVAACSDEWPVLAEALKSDRARKRVLVFGAWSEACPACHVRLPSIEVHKLRAHNVATARNCCGRVIVFRATRDAHASA